MNNNFEILEKFVLTVLLVCVFIAIGQEIFVMIQNQKVTLADILLLFIYIEVLGMIKEYWLAKVIRMSYPLFIAMTALARLIIMSAKDAEPIALIYESFSILIIALAIVALRARHLSFFNRDNKDK